MFKFYRMLMAAGILLLCFGSVNLYAQNSTSLGKVSDFNTRFKQGVGEITSQETSTLKLPRKKGKSLISVFRDQQSEDGQLKLTGYAEGHKHSSVSLSVGDKQVEGQVILTDKQQAYKIYTRKNEVLMRPRDIDSVICSEYPEASSKNTSQADLAELPPGTDVFNLNSHPEAEATIMLDFDGIYLESTQWTGGDTLLAEPHDYTDEQIYNIWKVVAEDFRPFDINVTTSESVFQNAPADQRIRNVFTTTTYFYSNAGGVAYIGSFTWSGADEEPCWTFNYGVKNGGETASHEVGHTMGLGHDGTVAHDDVSSEEYYAGQGDWAPIMGVGFYRPVTHWSQGEYQYADNDEDDIAIIASASNGFGFRDDDHGNTPSMATSLQIDSNDVLAEDNQGVISTEDDVDYFGFSMSESGTIDLDIQPWDTIPNLDIRCRLYDSLGNVITSVDPNGLPAAITDTLSTGTYYLAIDGVGEGDPFTDGYSDYGSQGFYAISGTISGGDDDDDNEYDCNGDLNGTAFIDSCGVCAGGNTGIEPNSTCPEQCASAEPFDTNAVYTDEGAYVKYEGKLYHNRHYTQGVYPDAANSPWSLVGFCKAAGNDCGDAEYWDAQTTYQQPGNEVVFEGDLYTNKWWTQNQTPDKDNYWGVWEFHGPCNDSLLPGNTETAALAGGSVVQLSASPNPVSGPVTIDIDNAEGEGKLVIVKPEGGNTVKVIAVQDATAPVQINVSDLKPGVYNIRYESDEQVSETLMLYKQ